MDSAPGRASRWRSMLPDTLEIAGKTLNLIGPDDYRWVAIDGGHWRSRAARFAYCKDDVFPGSHNPGLYVNVGLRDNKEPTLENAEATLEVARVNLEAEIEERRIMNALRTGGSIHLTTPLTTLGALAAELAELVTVLGPSESVSRLIDVSHAIGWDEGFVDGQRREVERGKAIREELSRARRDEQRLRTVLRDMNRAHEKALQRLRGTSERLAVIRRVAEPLNRCRPIAPTPIGEAAPGL